MLNPTIIKAQRCDQGPESPSSGDGIISNPKMAIPCEVTEEHKHRVDVMISHLHTPKHNISLVQKAQNGQIGGQMRLSADQNQNEFLETLAKIQAQASSNRCQEDLTERLFKQEFFPMHLKTQNSPNQAMINTLSNRARRSPNPNTFEQACSNMLTPAQPTPKITKKAKNRDTKFDQKTQKKPKKIFKRAKTDNETTQEEVPMQRKGPGMSRIPHRLHELQGLHPQVLSLQIILWLHRPKDLQQTAGSQPRRGVPGLLPLLRSASLLPNRSPLLFGLDEERLHCQRLRGDLL